MSIGRCKINNLSLRSMIRICRSVRYGMERGVMRPRLTDLFRSLAQRPGFRESRRGRWRRGTAIRH
jgi:hypothetical protein